MSWNPEEYLSYPEQAADYRGTMTDPNNLSTIRSYNGEQEDDYQALFEDEYNKGNPNLIYYRLFRFDPDNPETLHSPVGTTFGNEEHFITNTFSRTGINVDTSGQGFFATSNPDEAARWFRVKKDEGGGYYTNENTADSYAVFPVIGIPHNAQYFQEHPEVFSDFGIADGYIIDEMQIIGDPVYVWHNKNREKLLNQWSREENFDSSLAHIIKAIKQNRVDDFIKTQFNRPSWLSGTSKADFLSRAERAMNDGTWKKEYDKMNRRIQNDFMYDEDDRLLSPSERNKQKVRDLIDKLRKMT